MIGEEPPQIFAQLQRRSKSGRRHKAPDRIEDRGLVFPYRLYECAVG